MVGALDILSYPGIDGIIPNDTDTGLNLLTTVVIHGRLIKDLTGQTYTQTPIALVQLVREVIKQH